MRQTLYIILYLACICWQCQKAKEPLPQDGKNTEIDVLDFSIPGVDPKNIIIGKDVIIVHLPENYASGDFIKPVVKFGTDYYSQSLILNGLNFEDKEILLELESTIRERRKFSIIVIPHKAIYLTEPAKDLQLTIEPETNITVAVELKGTMATVSDGETLIYEPKVRFTKKTTGVVTSEWYPNPGNAGHNFTFTLPGAMVPGEYIAEVVWGAKTQLLSSQVTVKSGPVFFKRGTWYMLETNRHFEVSGFNFSSNSKYEAIILNDFINPVRISLKYEGPGLLSANLPESIGLGNYKITYLENGKEKQPYIQKEWYTRYSGDDHFYIQKNITQPIAKIVTQPSRRSSFETYLGYSLAYFPSVTEINREEPVLVYCKTWGATPDRYELVLMDITSRKEYVMPYSGTVYPIFDGFLSFLSYPVTKEVPKGEYEVYIVRGAEKTERYSEIIRLR